MGITFKSGSKERNTFRNKSSKPLKTDNMTTNAMVAVATPKTEIRVITCMKFFFSFENKYRLAMKNSVFNSFFD